MKPAFSKLEPNGNFYHAFDGRSRVCRVKLKDKNGTITLSKFLPNRNEKLRSVVLTEEESMVFRTLESSEKAKVVFRKLFG
mgnify:CR=1 FL=1